jgi:hypothetical protein
MHNLKAFKVYLVDERGSEVLEHNVYAQDVLDAQEKAKVLLNAALNPTVKSFLVKEIK